MQLAISIGWRRWVVYVWDGGRGCQGEGHDTVLKLLFPLWGNIVSLDIDGEKISLSDYLIH